MSGLKVINGTPTAISKFIREEEAKSQEEPCETNYLRFNLKEKKDKTEVWEVISKRHGFNLGVIKWYGSWRQYCFFPEPETVFNIDCMDDIMIFIQDMMEHKREDK